MTTGHERVDTPRHDVVDVVHGVEVRDPYRWLEDGDDAAVQRWVTQQNACTRAALDAVPSRSAWHARLIEFMNLPVVQAVRVCGDRLFLLERGVGEQQASLVVRSLSDPGGRRSLLIDPAADAHDAAVAIDWFFPSTDGELVAVGISEGGTENSVLRLVRSGDGSLLADEIPNCRAASVAWEPDGSGFFYTRYPEGDEYHRTVHHHTLGQPPADDPIVWAEHSTPQVWPEIELSPDGRYLLVDAIIGWSRSDQHLLDRSTGQWHTLIADVDATSHLVFASERRLIGATTLAAPRGRIVAVDLDPIPIGPGDWITIVPERDLVVGTPRPVGDGFVVTASRNGVDAVEWWSDDGANGSVVPGLGVCSVAQLATDRSVGTALALVGGFDAPFSVWRLEDPNHTPHAAPLHPVVDRDLLPDLTVSHIEYPSSDGTAVGMFLVHRRDVEPNDRTPAILNGYGGFAITETPTWSATIAAWCAAGGLYAIAGLRGGFEHGEAWHQAGKRANKQNVFDDFHSAADWLVSTGRTSRSRLAIAGGSNGGLSDGSGPDPAARPVPGRLVCGATARHDPVPEVPDRQVVDRRVRRPRGRRRVLLVARLFALPPRAARGSATRRSCSPPPRGTPGSIRCTPARWRRCCSGLPPISTTARCCCTKRAAPVTGPANRSANGRPSRPMCWRSSRGSWGSIRERGSAGGDRHRWCRRRRGRRSASGSIDPVESRSATERSSSSRARRASVALSIEGVDRLPNEIDGIAVRPGDVVAAADHPIGVVEIDHVVVMTDSLERTSEAFTTALGLECRRIRETDTVRQAFHRFADQGGRRGSHHRDRRERPRSGPGAVRLGAQPGRPRCRRRPARARAGERAQACGPAGPPDRHGAGRSRAGCGVGADVARTLIQVPA